MRPCSSCGTLFRSLPGKSWKTSEHPLIWISELDSLSTSVWSILKIRSARQKNLPVIDEMPTGLCLSAPPSLSHRSCESDLGFFHSGCDSCMSARSVENLEVYYFMPLCAHARILERVYSRRVRYSSAQAWVFRGSFSSVGAGSHAKI